MPELVDIAYNPDKLEYEYRDGGRDAAGYRSKDDCIIRAIAVHLGSGDADGETYKTIRRQANAMARADRRTTNFRDWKFLPRLLEHYGFIKVKMKRGQIKPTYDQAYIMFGDCIVTTNGHVCALRNGSLCDTWDGRWYFMEDEKGVRRLYHRKARSVYKAPSLGEDN